MLKTIHLFVLLFVLQSLSPALAQEEDTVLYFPDSIDYLEEEEYPVLLEQEQHLYTKDSVTGKALDSITWKKLTKDLNYSDTLHTKKKEEKQKSDADHSWNFPSFSFNSEVTKYILFAVVIAALGYLLYRLIGSAIFASNTTIKKTKATFEILHNDEQMMQNDLHSLLKEALRQKDYKTAIRILFIQSLQDLQQLEWIEWKKEKTNRDYLNELAGKEIFLSFGSMVLLYEKAWYSESVATQEDFEAFNNFKIHIRRV
ncbi:MAG: hypothetical protein H7282_14975 [Cytophagaceae bacterium]|nr:hypothetical protein [Cytophagaceae bacterium]